MKKLWTLFPLVVGAVFLPGVIDRVQTAETEKAVERIYVTAPHAPARQTPQAADAKSEGCLDCHTATDQPTMHANPGVVLGCTDCHGGEATVRWSGGHTDTDRLSADYAKTRDTAHVLPRYPGAWHTPSSATPERTYALLNKEAPEFIRFINPGDYRIVEEALSLIHI